MPGTLDQLPRGSRFAIIRLRSLGDCVLTTPAIHILKTSRPDIEIGVVVEPRFAALFEGNPDVSAVLEPSVAAVARWRPELALNLHGGTRSMMLTAASGARLRAGFEHHRGSGMYNIRIPRAQQILGEERTVHTAEHLASAMFYLGAPRQPIPRARLFTTGQPGIAIPNDAYAVIHPFASAPDKAWPAENFVAVAKHLRDGGIEPVIIAGPADDIAPLSSFQVIAAAPLSDIKHLLSRASFFVGNDSGPAHMAAAFGVPVTVIYGTSDPVIWAPWQVPSQVLVARGPIASVQVDEVIAALDHLRVAQ